MSQLQIFIGPQSSTRADLFLRRRVCGGGVSKEPSKQWKCRLVWKKHPREDAENHRREAINGDTWTIWQGPGLMSWRELTELQPSKRFKESCGNWLDQVSGGSIGSEAGPWVTSAMRGDDLRCSSAAPWSHASSTRVENKSPVWWISCCHKKLSNIPSKFAAMKINSHSCTPFTLFYKSQQVDKRALLQQPRCEQPRVVQFTQWCKQWDGFS